MHFMQVQLRLNTEISLVEWKFIGFAIYLKDNYLYLSFDLPNLPPYPYYGKPPLGLRRKMMEWGSAFQGHQIH